MSFTPGGLVEGPSDPALLPRIEAGVGDAQVVTAEVVRRLGRRLLGPEINGELRTGASEGTPTGQGICGRR
jgi:hypothetical protein